ncbi:unnamed protein product, partial [Symbiodinium sp. KB8]
MLLYGSPVDVHDFIRRLVDRQRRLRHLDQLLGEAVDEALGWWTHPMSSLPLNAATFESNIWSIISREVSQGGDASGLSNSSSPPDTSLAVLLQPGFPLDEEAVMQALPGFHPQIIAGLRRRAWREHVNTLGYSMDSRSSTWTQRELHLIQTDAEREIPNWPADEHVADFMLDVLLLVYSLLHLTSLLKQPFVNPCLKDGVSKLKIVREILAMLVLLTEKIVLMILLVPALLTEKIVRMILAVLVPLGLVVAVAPLTLVIAAEA